MSEDQFELDLNQIETHVDKVGVIDADSIMFNLGWFYAKAELLPNDDTNYSNSKTVPDFVHKSVEEFLERLRKKMGVDILHLHFTAGPKNRDLFEEFMGRPMKSQFRDSLNNSYKANRTDAHLPVGYHYTLRSLLQEPNAYIHDEWEADEAVILHKKLNPDWILSSNDKDVWKQHHGSNYFYDKRSKKPETAWTDVDKDYANYFPFLQAITGDPVDGFIGAKGIGPKKAEQFVNVNNTPAQNWQGVLDAFNSKGLDEAEALLNMRFASMSQLKIDDTGTPVIDLWKPERHHLEPVWK